SHNELTQMAGRAGRRGIDPEGKCVIALDARDGVEDLLRVVDGSPEPIESQFKLGYGSAALLLATGAPPEALRRRIESSFGQYQNLKRIRELEGEVRSLEAALAEVKRYAAPCGDFARIGRYRRARQEGEARRQAPGRGGRRGGGDGAEAEAGRAGVVRREGGPGSARSSSRGTRTGTSSSAWSRCSSSSAPCATAGSSRAGGSSPASGTTTSCSSPRASSATSSPASPPPRPRRSPRR